MGIYRLRRSDQIQKWTCISKIEHSEVVAVMSRDISKAKAYAKERGIANGTMMHRN